MTKKQISDVRGAAESILKELETSNPDEDTISDYAHDIIAVVVDEEEGEDDEEGEDQE